MKNVTKRFIFLMMIIPIILSFSAFSPNTTAAESIKLPIIMYHKIAKSGPSKYVTTVTQLENDFKAITSAGYTPVFLNEVINWVDGKGKLPDKPIVVTFDDGQYNNLCYVLPLAKKYNVKYVINPVTSYTEKSINDKDTGNPRYSNLSWDEIKQGYDSGYIEYGNHTHNMHRQSPRYGVAQKSSESLDSYTKSFKEDVNHAQELLSKSGIPTPNVFAYPFGKYTKDAQKILIDMGFRAMLTCNEHISVIEKGKPESLHALGRFNRSGNYSTENFMKKISINK